MTKRTRLMVLGADAPVGRACAKRLVERGYHVVTPGATSGASPSAKGVWEGVESERWAQAMNGCAGVINALAYTPETHQENASALWTRTQQILERAQAFGVRRVVYLSHRVAFGRVHEDALDEHSRAIPGESSWPLVDTLSVMESMHWGALVDELDCVIVGAPLVVGAHSAALHMGAQIAQIMDSQTQVHVAGVGQLARAAQAGLERGQRARRYLLKGACIGGDALKLLCARGRGSDATLVDAQWVLGALEPTWATAELGDIAASIDVLTAEALAIS